MSKVYEIHRDSHNRLAADITPDMAVAIKLLGEHEPRRIEKGIHAYVVLDVRTSFGPLDPVTRQKIEDAIVAVFKQVLSESAKNTIARLAGPELQELRQQLEQQTAEALEHAEKAATPA